MSLPVGDAPEQHFKSVQLATCSQPRALTHVELGIDWLPGDGCMYVFLDVGVPFLPFLQPRLMHISIGQYTATRRTPILQMCHCLQSILNAWQPSLHIVHLQPLGRSLHFGFSPSTPFCLLVVEMQRAMHRFHCWSNFEPVPHISWVH